MMYYNEKEISYKNLKKELTKYDFLIYDYFTEKEKIKISHFLKKYFISINTKLSDYIDDKIWLKFNTYEYGFNISLDTLNEKDQEYPDVIPFIKYIKKNYSDKILTILAKSYKKKNKKTLERVKDRVNYYENEVNQINNFINVVSKNIN